MTPQEIKKHHLPIIEGWRIKSQNGDKNAAIEFIRALTAYEQALKDIGYRTSDTGGRVIKRSKTWYKKMKPIHDRRKALVEATENGDYDVLREHILKVAKEGSHE